MLALCLFWHGQAEQSFDILSSKSVFDGEEEEWDEEEEVGAEEEAA